MSQTYAQNEMDGLTKGLNWVKNITGTGREIYDDFRPAPSPAPAPAPSPAAPKAFNWKPWAIGGGLILVGLVVLKMVFGKKSK